MVQSSPVQTQCASLSASRNALDHIAVPALNTITALSADLAAFSSSSWRLMEFSWDITTKTASPGMEKSAFVGSQNRGVVRGEIIGAFLHHGPNRSIQMPPRAGGRKLAACKMTRSGTTPCHVHRSWLQVVRSAGFKNFSYLCINGATKMSWGRNAD